MLILLYLLSNELYLAIKNLQKPVKKGETLTRLKTDFLIISVKY